MRAYYFDNIPGDQRLHHDSGRPLDLEYLDGLGIKLRTIPLDTSGGWETEIDKIAEQSGAPIRDIMDVTKEGLGDQFEYMLGKFFEEHMHDDEEIRYILSGAGFWDIRDYPTNEWIRIQVLPGDFVVIPPGIYHRFTLGESNAIKAVRLTMPKRAKYTSQARGLETDSSTSRARYLDARILAEALPISV